MAKTPSSSVIIKGEVVPLILQPRNIKGKVILVSRQGEVGSIVIFDPDWAQKNVAFDNLSKALVQWTFSSPDKMTQLHQLHGIRVGIADS